MLYEVITGKGLRAVRRQFPHFRKAPGQCPGQVHGIGQGCREIPRADRKLAQRGGKTPGRVMSPFRVPTFPIESAVSPAVEGWPARAAGISSVLPG